MSIKLIKVNIYANTVLYNVIMLTYISQDSCKLESQPELIRKNGG